MTDPLTPPPHRDSNPSGPAASLPEERLAALCHLLRNGASLSAACGKLGLTVAAALEAIAGDDEWQRQYLAVQQDLSRNVAAAIYLAAMKGSVAAQTFLLRHLPPPEWYAAAQAAALDNRRMSDAELEARCRALGIEFAPEALGAAAALGGAGPQADAAGAGPVPGPRAA